MPENVIVAVARRAECGEGPYWDARDGSVVWVDILGRQVLRTDARGETRVIDHPEMVGAAAPRATGGLVLAVESGFTLLDAAGELDSRIGILEPPLRMNDAKVDPAGRYWAGSCAMDFRAGLGALWRLDEGLDARLVLPDLTQPNGLGWSPDGTHLYLVETQDRVLLRFDFDPAASEIRSGPTVLADGFTGYPDGLAVDAAGHLWIAEFGGGAVHEFDPAGAHVRVIEVPTAQPTSCSFVGPRLDRLWVTSAATGLDPADVYAGSVFEVTGTGAVGTPVSLFRG
ncbi:calcium-binding protein [Enemella evansiae]|uniref:SMP-30/gluconolactonase/LRE family protein n=1 Tax=Enemella evansiae TaxID=2016499 RepID=UPI000B976D44|nr:SMP-30/gluconolactonase/LRE family protein [Enemella evansiae]OYN99055.1 calcium-binding protein [Enemella evansiae]